jgi:hypothetical protein
MRLYLSGHAGQENITDAVNFFIFQLFDGEERKRLSLKIDFTAQLKDSDGTRISGYFEPPYGNRRSYYMAVDTTQSKKKILSTIAHELVHVRQHFSGSLSYETNESGDFVTVFNDEEFPMYYEVGDRSYYFLPWEVEAFGLEYALTELYRSYRKYVARQARKQK